MTTTAHGPSEVEAYLARVRAELADVPADERSELLSEVEASLYETAYETGGSVAARLGPPEDFAAELRSAAGLGGAPSRRRRFVAPLERALAAKPIVTATRVLHDLAPVWWVLRAYLAVAAVALLVDASWSVTHASVPHFGSAETGLAAIAAAIVTSVALGLWTRRAKTAWRGVAAAVNLALVAAAVPVAQHLAEPAPVFYERVIFHEKLPGLAYNGKPVRNVYPFSRSGRRLHDVFLYTDAGTPIDFLTGHDPNRRVLRTAGGRKVFNVFPIRYYDPGTRIVRHPNAGPRVKVPRLATPALPRRH